ncbi:hypothetical protein ACLOAV_006078 [Pseudogymnoascus australis]
MQFTSVFIALVSLMAVANAAPDALVRKALDSAVMQYPGDLSMDLIKRAQAAARCNTGCPCNWCGMTICCQCTC